MSLWQLYGLSTDFISSPHYIVNTYEQAMPYTEFPNVTICNFNRFPHLRRSLRIGLAEKRETTLEGSLRKGAGSQSVPLRPRAPPPEHHERLRLQPFSRRRTRTQQHQPVVPQSGQLLLCPSTSSTTPTGCPKTPDPQPHPQLDSRSRSDGEGHSPP